MIGAHALRGIKCGDRQCVRCERMLGAAEDLVKKTNDELAKLVNEVLVDVPLHSRSTSILVAVQRRLLER